MKAWADMWALRLGVGATCLILIVGLASGIGPSTMVLRSVVVGAVLYLGLRILGGLVGAALLRLAVEHKLAKKQAAKAAEEEGAASSDRAAAAGVDTDAATRVAIRALAGEDGVPEIDEGKEDTTAARGAAA